MRPELREAAERLRRMRQESESHDGGYPANAEGRRQSLYDHAALAEAYLAEHRADDAEPITEDWLRSVGFDTADNPAWVWIGDNFKIARHRVGGRWQICYLDDNGPSTDIPGPNTRHDLRQLCRALGIELREDG